jgi:hypothetical protein
MTNGSIFAQITNLKDKVLTPYHGLDVAWFHHWHPALDEALKSLPEMESCPHDLFRLMIQTPGSTPKRTALITERGVPVAVAGLRQIGWHCWEPITQWIIPGVVFPARPGYLIPALESLGVEVWVAWWRMESPPPASRLTRCLTSTLTHRMRCADDFEGYWRETKHFKNVRNMRNRCQGFTLAVNSPGSAEWTIRNWEANWRNDPTIVAPGLPERIVAAQYLENQGRHYTLLLLDLSTPIAGATMTVHHNDLVAGVIYREPEYDRYGVGIRLLDLTFSFAAESGFETYDLGGKHDYKKNWAPQAGEHWLFNICPEPLFRAKQAANWTRQIRGEVAELTHLTL